MSAEDLGKVSAIAYQCVEEGGSAVIMASAIYKSYDDTFIDDNLLCNPSLDPITKVAKKSNAIGLDIFPNPAQDNVTLMVTILEKEPFDIILTDYTGKILRKISNDSLKTPIYTLNTEDLCSGVYFCRLLTARGSIITKKINYSKIIISLNVTTNT